MLVVLVGCVSTPARLEVLRVDLAREAAPPIGEGTCPATLRVHVVDATHASVPGAEVTMRQRVSMNAPSMVPSRNEYRTAAVITDPQGEAWVCRPERVPRSTDDYFTRRDGGQIEARLGSRMGVLDPPFSGPLVLTP